jgi:hypothetical protein
MWLLRRKKKLALRYTPACPSSRRPWAAARHAAPHSAGAVPAVHGAMLLAASRPMATITLPSTKETIILAMDVSGSMRATDVQPNRLVASQEAAKAFLAELPRNVRVGIVAFAGHGPGGAAPTLSREDLVAAIDKFQLQRATATGSAIVVSLAELFPDDGIDLPQMTYGSGRPRGLSLDQSARPRKRKEFTPGGAGLVQLGRHHPADRRPAHHRRGHAGSRQDGGRPRRAHLYRGHRHRGRRNHRLRGLVDAGAAGRRHTQGSGHARPRPSISMPAPPRT